MYAWVCLCLCMCILVYVYACVCVCLCVCGIRGFVYMTERVESDWLGKFCFQRIDCFVTGTTKNTKHFVFLSSENEFPSNVNDVCWKLYLRIPSCFLETDGTLSTRNRSQNIEISIYLLRKLLILYIELLTGFIFNMYFHMTRSMRPKSINSSRKLITLNNEIYIF